jgi:hypothetical protein
MDRSFFLGLFFDDDHRVLPVVPVVIFTCRGRPGLL